MRAGNLRHSIIIQRATVAQDACGQPVETWATFATANAEILPLRGTELFSAQQFETKVTSKIRIRYIKGVSSKMRVLFGSRVYQVESIIDSRERHVELVLMCSEVEP